ncbi:MAG: putative translation initiation factor eIF-2B subunit 2-like protein [Candidatus Heimdallarchaeota archaeon LC_3]|nr:MAG: putative translation initiation factor eIF-2B subunit 2-like protein [Candidatus Heimdallarchaeota archaeon LC_3]
MANSEFLDFKKSLIKLGFDIELSATQILDKTIELFFSYIQNTEEIPKIFQKEISSLLPSLQPEMSTFEKLNEILNEIKGPWTKSNLNLCLKKLREDIIQNEKGSIKRLIEIMRTENIATIVTISYSKLVFNSIIKYNKLFDLERLIISASSPKFEGVKLANDLKLKIPNIELILVDDSRLANYLMKYQEKGVVLIGCDSIFHDESVLNKSGSFSLAIMSKHFEIPYYVIGTKFKIRNVNYSNKMIRNQELQELPWYNNSIKDGKMIIENKLFDHIPRDLITKIFY